MKNTCGFNFVQVDIEKDEFNSLLSLNIGDEEKTRNIFEEIKSLFEENTDEPDCVIDLLDENDDIVDDYAVTFSQIKSITGLLGHHVTQ